MPASFKMSPSETCDRRSSFHRAVLSPHRAVASFGAVKVLAARRRGIPESMIRNSANRFPKFWVTERRGRAKLNIEGLESQVKIGLAPDRSERYLSATLWTMSGCGYPAQF